MKTFDINIPVRQLTFDELDESDRELVMTARKATYRSYSPYSHFSVGAAIRLSNGTVIEGSNQENAAFPSGICAERTACYYAHASHPDAAFDTIAIAARGTDGDFLSHPISPCGACRQALLEYESLAGHGIRVILAATDHVYILDSVASLLPLAFTDLG